MMVRALTFRKRFAQVKHEKMWWAMLGHPDEMECSALTSMTLEDIGKYNDELYKMDSDVAYHHVVYLIDSDSVLKCQSSDEEIWAKGTDFLSVTRIHFPEAIELHDQFDKLNQYFSELASKPEYNDISWRSYYTIELSDMVLISRSKSFQMLSQWSLLATKTWLVGSAYTYFCLPGELLEKSHKKWPNYLRSDYVDFMAIRFSVQGSGADEELLKTRKYLGYKYASSPFRVAGNEDAIICAQNVPVHNLLRLYQSWYRSTSQILVTFRDIITRIGTDWQRIPPEISDLGEIPAQTALETHSKKVLQKVRNRILSNADKPLQNRAWLRPLVELTNALVHMSQSATLDEPVFLILPAINAFWDNVLDDSEPLLDDALYLRFAELCIHTMEHLMRAEGQLSHRPEMRPLAFDLPVFMLEYATTFLLTFSNELSQPDGENADQSRFLLVPSADAEVATEEPFEARGKKPGLLQTTVPFSLLYNPRQLLPALCHEMAHYVGETLRMRKERYWYFLNATATVLIDYFFDSVKNDANKFQEYLVNEFLDASLRTYIQENPYNGETDIVKLPLQIIVDMIGNLVDGTFSHDNYDAYVELARDYVLSEYRGAQIHSYPPEHIDSQRLLVKTRINDLRLSFREAYADICMLYCLELKPNEYLDVAVHRWEGINSSTFLRVYACLFTSGYSQANILEAVELWGQQNKVSSKERNSARKELTEWSEWIQTEYCTERYLVEYLAGCWGNFEKYDLRSDIKAEDEGYTTRDIFEKIKNIGKETQYKDILKVIDQGRKIVLTQF